MDKNENRVQAAKAALPEDGRELIFALDIGTRSVIGIVGIPEGDVLKLLAVASEQHTRRAVVDGQIEDIAQTARVAELVKDRLEQQAGVALREVHIAAAGRALRTVRSEFTMDLDESEPILSRQVMELEAGAIQAAYAEAEKEREQDPAMNFICVGHSVVKYWLDGYEMSTLLDHRGKRAKAEIIATFLPSEVVESLYAVMQKIGLTVKSVTLEPIAAMNAVIPRELRMLNLALVDIGGGTSDIAISNGGSVVAYTMATVAGDELTETVMRECLVDFETAEQVKIALGDKRGRISYRDILGFEYDVSAEELYEKLSPAVSDLADEIAGRIMEANGKSPAAVFLVGGGSQAPGLCEMVAERLAVDRKKVAVGGNNYMKRMVVGDLRVDSPEFATPVGIAVTAMADQTGRRLSVTLNGKRVSLLKNDMTTVLELLLLNGSQYGQIMGRSGASVTYELNGRKKVVRGGVSVPASILVNGSPATISTTLRPDDEVVFEPACAGEDAAPTVRSEFAETSSPTIFFNDMEYTLEPEIYLNGALASGDRLIQNGDTAEIRTGKTLSELCARIGVDAGQYIFFANGEECGEDYKLSDGDRIQAAAKPRGTPAKAVGAAERLSTDSPAGGAGEAAVFQPITIRLNGRALELLPKPEKMPYQFVDLLNYVDFDPSKPKGNIELSINGREASYLDMVRDGDQIVIRWD